MHSQGGRARKQSKELAKKKKKLAGYWFPLKRMGGGAAIRKDTWGTSGILAVFYFLTWEVVTSVSPLKHLSLLVLHAFL